MSMNLYFKVVGVNDYVDFPFQTPSQLTTAVMNATTLQKRMDLVKDYIYGTQWNQEDKYRCWRRCWGLMNSSFLELRFG